MAIKVDGSNEATFPSEVKQAKGGYGQNGYGGPSSLTPNDAPFKGQSGFLPGPGTPVNDQLRKVKADALPTTYGCKNPNAK